MVRKVHVWPPPILLRRNFAFQVCEVLMIIDSPPLSLSPLLSHLVDVSDIFYFFFCSGRGGRYRGARRGVGSVSLLKIPRRGGGLPGGEGLGVRLWGIGEFFGGGVNIFFRCRNVHQAQCQWSLGCWPFVRMLARGPHG